MGAVVGTVMRRAVRSVGAGAAFAGLAIGSLTPGSVTPQSQVGSALQSLGAKPNLQIHIDASISGSTVPAQAVRVVRALSLSIAESSQGGQPLGTANKGQVDVDYAVNLYGSPVLELREVHQNLFVWFDLTRFGEVVPTNQAQGLAIVQSLLGGRWFELTPALIKQLAQQLRSVHGLPGVAPGRLSPYDRLLRERLMGLLPEVKGLESDFYNALFASRVAPYPTGGVELRGTLQSVVTAVLPAVQRLVQQFGQQLGHQFGGVPASLGNVGSVPGIFSVNVQIRQPGTKLYRIDTEVIVPTTASGGSGGAFGFQIAFSHHPLPVVAPAGATLVSPSLIQRLKSLGSLGTS
jgi:hypothetical protein